MKTYWTYIMSNKSRRLYVGFTSNLPYRVFQHQNKLYPDSFTARYEFYMLVWYEPFESVIRAKMREVELKGWRRAKKLKLILAQNPDWADLSREWKKIQAGSLNPMRLSGSSEKLLNPKFIIAKDQRSRPLIDYQGSQMLPLHYSKSTKAHYNLAYTMHWAASCK